MATPAELGWGNPGKKHDSLAAREYGRQHITTIEASDGSRFSVRTEVAPLFRGLLEELLSRGYRIKGAVLDDWGWFVRTIAGSTKLSNHSWGLAIDINALTNPQGRVLKTDMPGDIVEIAKRWGLRWGGTYASNPDGMHFEYIGSRDQAVRFVQQLRRDLEALAAAKNPTQENDMERIYTIITVPAPDPADDGLQMIVMPEIAFDDVFSVDIKANDNGRPTGVDVEPCAGYEGMLALSFFGLGWNPDTQRPTPAPVGNVGVILGVKR